MKIITHVSVAVTLYYIVQISRCDYTGKSRFLLPGNVKPSHYDVNWEFLDNCTRKDDEFYFQREFNGTTRIMITVTEPNVTDIEVNSFNLELTRAVIMVSGGPELIELRISQAGCNRKATLRSPTALPMSKTLNLYIAFWGRMVVPGERGIFSRFDAIESTETGKVLMRQSIGTLFEPASARAAFPCFDEPKYKATFKVTLNVSTCVLKKGYIPLSNAPLTSIEEGNDRSIAYFENTGFPMPTYLLAFTLTSYAPTAVKFFNSSYPDLSKTEWKELRTWGLAKEVGSWIGYVGQEVGARLLELFSSIFNIGYPLKKMDQVFIFRHPAMPLGMENWGLISYGPGMSSNHSWVKLLAHEIAHQWSGNLVTCQWWSEVWLNEGFATYFSYYVLDKLKMEQPNTSEWNPNLLLITGVLTKVLSNDKRGINRALTTPVEDPARYPYFFDEITYSKGGSVLRMWNHTLGEKAFVSAMQIYMQDRKFGSATPELLLKAFDRVAEISVSDFEGGRPSKYFKNWHTESGFPLVEVKGCQNDSSVYLLTQKVFTIKNSEHVKWTIPISYSTNVNMDFDKTHAMLWLKETDKVAKIVLPQPVSWIIVNNQFTGYYRVKYDRKNYEHLFEYLMSMETYVTIHEANRIQIFQDLFAVLIRDQVPDVDFRFFMDLSLYLKHEKAYFPWKAALDHVFDFFNTMLAKNEAVYRFFKIYVNDLLQDNYAKLTFDEKPGDSFHDRELREEIVKWACKMDHPDCIKQSYIFVNRHSLRSQIYSKVYDTALCTSIRRSDENDWDILWGSYQSTVDSQERNILLHGISCSKDLSILARLLMMSLDKTVRIHKDERKSIFMAVLDGNPQNIDLVFNFFANNYESIEEMYGGNNPVGELLISLAKKLATDEEVRQLEGVAKIIEENERIRLKENAIAEAMDICITNNRWIKNKSEDVNIWILSHYG